MPTRVVHQHYPDDINYSLEDVSTNLDAFEDLSRIDDDIVETPAKAGLETIADLRDDQDRLRDTVEQLRRWADARRSPWPIPTHSES